LPILVKSPLNKSLVISMYPLETVVAVLSDKVFPAC
jgi:hypothetical protein